MKKMYKIFYRNGFSNEKFLTKTELEYAKKTERIVMIQEIINKNGNIYYKNIYIK